MTKYANGLTKRELYAAMALQGLLSVPMTGYQKSFAEYVKDVANSSVTYADALLAALEKEAP
jgi:hypothetical protein